MVIGCSKLEIRNFISISSLTGECAAQKLKNFCSSSLWTCLHHMVILRSQNKITDFLMILPWASPFHLSETESETELPLALTLSLTLSVVFTLTLVGNYMLCEVCPVVLISEQ